MLLALATGLHHTSQQVLLNEIATWITLYGPIINSPVPQIGLVSQSNRLKALGNRAAPSSQEMKAFIGYFERGSSVTNAINILLACIYMSVKQAYF